MKATRYSNQDELLQLVIIPLYVVILNTILLGNRYWQDWRTLVFATVVALVPAFATWLVNNIAGLYVNRLFPHLSQIPTRLLWLIGWCLCSGNVAVVLIYSIYVWADGLLLPLQPGRLGWAMVYELLVVILVITLYEGVRAFERWEQKLRETEELKKANLQSQFESLKSQINPHFLFNSLNTLSSLIEEDPQQAELFLEEMASVYRYLLRSNETQLATLAAELDFAQSYFHLLRTRYGEHIHLDQDVDIQFYERLLPPLTLQLLLENTVKHNVILPEQPLTIQIQSQPDGHLVVRNNLQRKNSRVLSNQIGLVNIATQFRLLGGGTMRVDDDGLFFSVTLPLLQP
ncbi:sensor histidine kinase [Fibrella sp. WM1]|uniref:sensor histidine kinase n=1 Tax=Fibrella musci TaxID=3242485 RepID=UPI00352226E9